MAMLIDQISDDAERGRKLFAVLVDPDKYDDDKLLDLIAIAQKGQVDYFLVGGSLMVSDRFSKTIEILKAACNIPVVIFPGSNLQINQMADGILLLSLISGRNPEYLIGQHVVAAPYLKKSSLQILPAGYMLIGDEGNTTANYMSNTLPIPAKKEEIAVCTAMAGEMLGLKLIYMDGGSGAENLVPVKMIRAVKESLTIPLIVGGGIRRAEDAILLWEAGADMVVVGNAVESSLGLVAEISLRLNSRI